MLLELARPRRRLISITPLIDVVFILLLFFMLSSTFNKARQMEVTAASPGQQQQHGEATRIVLSTAETAVVNHEVYPLQGPRFTALLDKLAKESGPVILVSGADVRIQALVQLVDRMHQAGVANLKLGQSVTP